MRQPPSSPQATIAPASRATRARWVGYARAVGACLGTALIASLLHDYLDPANTVMLFLLTVVLVAMRDGRGPAVAAAFMGVAAFDFFFVPPRFSFAVSDVQYLVTFAVMLTVALIIGQMTARLKLQAQAATDREQRTLALYGVARDFSGALTVEQLSDITSRYIKQVLNARCAIFLPDDAGRLTMMPALAEHAHYDDALAHVAYARDEAVGPGLSSDDTHVLYLPLKAPMRLRGVLAVAWPRGDELTAEQRQLLETVASLVASVLERIHYIAVAQDALIKVESERLRNSLLAALSHDLRTPLTALVGLSDSLTLSEPLNQRQREAAEAIHDEALRMNSLVDNLLDMAKLQAGPVRLRKEWQPLEEVVGSCLKALERRLAGHRLRVDLAPDLPLLEFDAVLIERVLCNLLENATKYAARGSEICVAARPLDVSVEIAVLDHGPGVAPGSELTIFEKFVRGQAESATSGVGLGLAICHAIVEAHGGHIKVDNRREGGARFSFTLPLGNPPAIDVALMEKLGGAAS